MTTNTIHAAVETPSGVRGGSSAALYGAEVPAYNTLVDVSREVNQDFMREHGKSAERLGEHRTRHC